LQKRKIKSCKNQTRKKLVALTGHRKYQTNRVGPIGPSQSKEPVKGHACMYWTFCVVTTRCYLPKICAYSDSPLQKTPISTAFA